MTARTRIGSLAVAALCASACVSACAPPATDDGAVSHPPLWEVRHDERTSLLVGTMHAGVSARVLPERVWDAIDAARVVFTEADVRGVDPGEVRARVTLPDGASLRDLVSAQDFEAVRRAVSPGFTAEQAERLQPWFLEGQAALFQLERVPDPIDQELVARAASAGAALAFFETWQEQVDLLNALGLDDGLFVLLRTAYDLEGARAAHLAWQDAYTRGDLDQMTALAFDAEEIARRPRYYEEIVGRHARWMSAAVEAVEQGDAVIAAGFMHMLTDDGLPARLAAAGYEVTLVSAPAE